MNEMLSYSTPETDVQEATSVRAYFLAQSAGFAPGRELEFWLQAEAETIAGAGEAPAPAKPKRAPRKKAVAGEAGAEAVVAEAPKKTTRRKVKAD